MDPLLIIKSFHSSNCEKKSQSHFIGYFNFINIKLIFSLVYWFIQQQKMQSGVIHFLLYHISSSKL